MSHIGYHTNWETLRLQGEFPILGFSAKSPYYHHGLFQNISKVGVINCRILVLKIAISTVVSEQWKLRDCDYRGRFRLRFHALIDVYPAAATFLAENEFMNWFSVFSCVYRTLCPAMSCLLWACGIGYPIAFLLFHCFDKILSSVENTIG